MLLSYLRFLVVYMRVVGQVTLARLLILALFQILTVEKTLHQEIFCPLTSFDRLTRRTIYCGCRGRICFLVGKYRSWVGIYS